MGPPFLNGEALWLTAINRNKSSVLLDIRDDGDRAALMSLIRSADIVVTNQPPDVERKLGVDYDVLRRERDDLTFVSISGFDLTGEHVPLTYYDMMVEGYSGIMDIPGAGDGSTQNIGAPADDMLTGQEAARQRSDAPP